MANWGIPQMGTPYPDYMDDLKNRDIDAGTLFLADPSNPPVGIIRYNRALNLFQEWNGSAWINKIISASGGGTGSGSGLPALGTMAVQNANNVNITGGNMQGMTSVYSNGEIRAASHIRTNGQLVTGSSQIVLTDGVGKIPAINNSYFANTNIDGSYIASGLVSVNRLGIGAGGSGGKVLLDNGVWTDKDMVGGGMIEILHNDITFGTDEQSRQFVLPWTVAPISIKKITIEFRCGNNPIDVNGSIGNLAYTLDSVNLFTVSRRGPLIADTYPYTAFNHITQV